MQTYSPLWKKTCVRQVVLDKWFPLVTCRRGGQSQVPTEGRCSKVGEGEGDRRGPAGDRAGGWLQVGDSVATAASGLRGCAGLPSHVPTDGCSRNDAAPAGPSSTSESTWVSTLALWAERLGWAPSESER